jgi:hypothetical protein
MVEHVLTLGKHCVAQSHILNTGHQYGPIEQIMALIEKARKGKLMNTKENFHIYLHNQANSLIHEQKQDTGDRHNSLFDLATRYTTHRIHHQTTGYK